MGREAECIVTYKGRSVTRKVLLEMDELVVRTAAADATAAGKLPRLGIKRAEITHVAVEGGTLSLTWKGDEVSLALGAQAARWADDIMNPKSRLDKFGVKARQRAALVRVCDAALAQELVQAGVEVKDTRGKGLDMLFFQADDATGLSMLAGASKRITTAGALWLITPRGVEGVKDVDVMQVARGIGLVDVKVVRFSETHTALKFMWPKDKR